MKFKRFLLILYLVSIAAGSRILTDEENKKRLDTCGQAIDITENQVISFATGITTLPTATFISPRHILTFADLVLKPKGKWIGTKNYYNEKICLDEKISMFTVPKDALTHLNFGFDVQIECSNSQCTQKKKLLEIENGFIFCSFEWRQYHHHSLTSYPMVLVTKTDYGVQWPCLRTNEKLLLAGTPLDLYKYSSNDKVLQNDTVEFLGTHRGEVWTKHPTKRDGSGVLITQQYPHELIAMGGYAEYHHMAYIDVRTLQDEFCVKFYICPREGATLPQPKTGKLTEEEDSLRKKNCRDHGDSAYGIAKYNGIESAVTLISPRHVLMSGDPILKLYQFMTNCNQETKHLVKIDLELLPGLELHVADVSLKPVSGIVICNGETSQFAMTFSFPIIVEVQPSNDSISTPCLPDRVLDFRNNSVKEGKNFLNAFYLNGAVMYQWLELSGDSHSPYIITKKPEQNNPKGAALLESIRIESETNKTWHLAGMYAGEDEQKSWYFDIQWILEDLCELAGICQPLASEQPSVTTITPNTEAPDPPTTDAPSTTVSPAPSPTETPTTEIAILEKSTMESQVATEKATTEESTSEKPASSKAPETSTKSPESTMAPVTSTPEEESASLEPMEPIPTIDLDKEFREFQERQEKEDRGDWDEWGNDFYRSADFFSSGRRSELFVGFLVVVMVVWRMILG